MKYHQIERMCRPNNTRETISTRGCFFDGLGCTGGNDCSIHNDPHAFNKDISELICWKQQNRLRKQALNQQEK